VNGQPDPRESTVDHVYAGGYGRSNRDVIVNSSYDAELPVGAVTLYSFSTFSYRDIKDARGAYIPRPPAMADRPMCWAPRSCELSHRVPGLPAHQRTRFPDRAGARGQLAGWDWDASSSFGRDSVWLGAENTLNPSIGPTSPTSFFMGRQIQSLWVNNLDLTHDYDIGLAKPVTVAVGFEHRWEKFQSKAGEPDSYRNGGYQIPSDGTPFGQLYGGLYPSPGWSRSPAPRPPTPPRSAATMPPMPTSRPTSPPAGMWGWPGASSTTTAQATR
jgi:iron complex outermembrane receptor protein